MNDSIGSGSRIHNIITSANAARQQSIAEDLFSSGHSFSHVDYYSFAASEVKDFVFDPTNYTPPVGALGRVVSEVPKFSATGGPITIDIYADTDSNNDGASCLIFNRDATSPNVSSSIIRLNPTINNVGVRFSGYIVPSTGVSSPNSTGAETQQELPFALDITKKYLIRVTNTGAAGVLVGARVTFFEL